MNFQIKYVLLYILALLLLGSCVIRLHDDGSRDIDVSEKTLISDFNESQIGKQYQIVDKNDITFQLINGEDILNVVDKNEFTWIYIWGSWCTPCVEKLPSLIKRDAEFTNMNILLVAEDYKVSRLQQTLFEAGFKGQAYILDSQKYGNKTKEKVLNLNSELCRGCNYFDGFPQNYIYNQNAELLKFSIGKIHPHQLEQLGISN